MGCDHSINDLQRDSCKFAVNRVNDRWIFFTYVHDVTMKYRIKIVNQYYYYFGCFYGAFFLKRTNFFDENYNQMGKRHARIGHNALRFELTIKTASRYRRFSHGFQKKKKS